MSHGVTPKFSRTTPFPNELIDQAMPRLSDTQWRVLSVVVRQTLGWHDPQTGSRKVRDWLSQSQLKARTGRNTEALAAAIDALVGQGYLVVEDEAGHPLDAPQKRRAYRGRCYYRLADAWLQRVGLFGLHAQDKRFDQTANSVFRSGGRKTEFVSSGKSNTTKETVTKEKMTNGNPFQVEATHSQRAEADFYAAFVRVANQHGKVAGHTILAAVEKEQLQRWLSVTPEGVWKPLLARYFKSDLSYVVRHEYSLAAFLNTCHILRHQGGR